MMKRSVSVFVLAVVFASPVAVLAVDGKKAQYIGGTIAGMQEGSEGKLDSTGEIVLMFDAGKRGAIEIPYASIAELEYGQKAGRRIGVAIMVNPLALFSKKRKHYLTISYTDAAGKDQAAVFELGKDIIRTTLKILETRSGKELQFQDEEARKSMGGGR